jgi:ATP-dependent Clp protease ATP-binding subunit ClpC
MIRMQTNLVLRYFEPLDVFLKIRIFTPEEARKLVETSNITNRRSYQDLVINACVVNYSETVLSKLPGDVNERLQIEQQAYRLCVEVNPHLDINVISIPAPAQTSHLHLLEPRATPIIQRDYTRFKNMEQELAKRIVGQERAIRAVSRAVKKALIGLRDPFKPMGTFFFIGQTGVGKTELAKVLTRYLYQDLSRMVRIDCSEYAMPHEYAKLIGAPPGYIGHSEGGILTDAIAHQGAAVVLFDEIEKSDPKVHDLLLQVMDEGFITNNKGQKIGFHNVLIILTSNIGTERLDRFRNRIGFDPKQRQKLDERLFISELTSALKMEFKPEFINRITEIVFFNPITLNECKKIVMIFLEDVRLNAKGLQIELKFSEKVAPFLAEKGYKPEYGARELKRTVEKEVEDPLSDMLIEGKIREGDRIRICLRKDRLSFHRN